MADNSGLHRVKRHQIILQILVLHAVLRVARRLITTVVHLLLALVERGRELAIADSQGGAGMRVRAVILVLEFAILALNGAARDRGHHARC